MIWLLGFQSFFIFCVMLFILYRNFSLQKEMLKYMSSKNISEKVEADHKEKILGLEYQETKNFFLEQKKKSKDNKIDLGNGNFVSVDDLIPVMRAEDLE